MKSLFDPNIELVIDKGTGCLVNCYALDKNGNRDRQLPIIGARESYNVSGPGIVSVDMHSFRVKRTEIGK